jgi:hypothetical protein
MFRKHSGRDFDVFTAIMAGLIAYLQSAMLIGMGKVWHVMDDIVHFNTKAEQSTGQSRSKLLQIASERTARSNIGSRRPNKVAVGVEGPNMALLAKTTSAGAAHFLREQIERYGHRSPEICSFLSWSTQRRLPMEPAPTLRPSRYYSNSAQTPPAATTAPISGPRL